jgi:hypothetical protein
MRHVSGNMEIIKQFRRRIAWSFLFAWAAGTFIPSLWDIFKGFVLVFKPNTNPQGADIVHIESLDIPTLAFWLFTFTFFGGAIFSIIELIYEVTTHKKIHIFKETGMDRVQSDINAIKQDTNKQSRRINRTLKRLVRKVERKSNDL